MIFRLKLQTEMVVEVDQTLQSLKSNQLEIIINKAACSRIFSRGIDLKAKNLKRRTPRNFAN